MVTVTATEYQQNIGKYQDIAMREPVIITKQGREAFVLLSMDDFKRHKAATNDGMEVTSEMIDTFIANHKHTLELLADR